MEREDERNLIRMIKAGDFRQFEKLIVEYQNALYIFIWRVVRDEDEAKDLCQETLLKAYKSMKSFREESKFSSWLFQIGYRKALDVVAKKKRHLNALKKMEMRSESPGGERDFELKETGSLIGKIMGNLQYNHRVALHLFYKEEMTYTEIALIMNVPINSVKSHIFRGKEIIRKKLAQMNQLTKQTT